MNILRFGIRSLKEENTSSLALFINFFIVNYDGQRYVFLGHT